MKDKMIAALLAFFFGGIGIHKFYLKQHFQGFLYLIFSWTLIPAVISFFESLRFLFMSEKSFHDQYNLKIQKELQE